MSLLIALTTTAFTATAATATATATAATTEQIRPVVLLGTTGVRWSDVSALDTPALDALADSMAVGNAAVRSVRSVTCPADGWLAISSGTRAADLEQDTGCRALQAPQNSVVPGWADHLTAAASDEYEAVPGLLGERLQAAGVQTIAFGPGAAIATAAQDGWPVGTWSPLPAKQNLAASVAGALDGGAGFVVVDLGSVREADPDGTDPDAVPLVEVDRRVAATLDGAARSGVEPLVLVSSLADRGDEPALQITALGGAGTGLLTSAATRQEGMVLGTDLTATIAASLGLPDQGFIGSPVKAEAVSTADPVASLIDVARHATVARPLVPPFYLGVVVLNLLLYAGVWFGLSRPPGQQPADERQRHRVLQTVRTAGLAVAALPVSLLLANLTPWWRAAAPAATLAATTAMIVVAVVGLAAVGPWRHAILGSAGVVAGVTALVIAIDVSTGARFQLSAVIGAPTLAAGRFYGFNNTAFALTTAASLMAASALVDPLVRTGRRRAAAAVVAVIGLALTSLDGSSTLGADFGGPPALIPAFTVLALLVGGARFTWRRVVVVLSSAMAITLGFAILDWLRPADQRTHLGNLVQTLIDGGLWPVVARKASSNLHIIANNLPLTLLSLAGLAFAVATLIKPIRRMVLSPDGGRYGWLSHGTALNRLSRAAPTIVPWLLATATALTIGFAVNDSGISIPALGVAITVPLVIVASATWLLGLTGSPPTVLPTEAPPLNNPVADIDPTSDSSAKPARTVTGRSDAPGRQRRWLLWPGTAAFGLAAILPILTAAPAEAADSPDGDASAPIVLIGVSGLRWDDVGTLNTPNLWSLSRTGAVGQVVVRSVRGRACPADGWLTVSSGQRVADDVRAAGCRTLHDPITVDEITTVAAWPAYLSSATRQPYAAQPGLLGDLVAAHGVTATAIGPGAAIALADQTGAVTGTYVGRPSLRSTLTVTVRESLATNELIVVDAGTLRDPGYETTDPLATEPTPAPIATAEPGDTVTAPPGSDALLEPSRAEQAEQIDERIGAVLNATDGTDATVLVVSLADSGPASLHLAVATGDLPGQNHTAEGLLTSASTRQAGVVQTTDVLPTLLAQLGLSDQAEGLAGATLTAVAGPATPSARLTMLADIDRHASQITRASGGFSTRLMFAQILLAALAALVLSGAGARLTAHPQWLGPGSLPVLRGAAVALASAPVASFLAGLVPWWQAALPRAAFWLTIGGWVLVITGAALLGPWRRSRVGPLTVVATVTAVVLGVDAALGGRLVIDAPLGAHRLLGARFYGASNQSFALLTVAALITSAVVARALLARGARTWAWLSVTAIGVVTVVLDGLPGMGSDFGGPPALIPAFALLAFMVAGRRVRWRTVLLILGGAGLVVTAFALFDYSRPAADRTHVGRFVASVVSGGLWPMLSRKVSTNLRLLASLRYLLPTVAGTALTLWVVGGPGRWSPPRLPRGDLAKLMKAEPLLRPTAAAIAVAMVLGFAVNDSGIVVPATGLALAVPCLVTLVVGWRQERLSADEAGPSTSGSAPAQTHTAPVGH